MCYKFRFEFSEMNPLSGVLKYRREGDVCHKKCEQRKRQLSFDNREHILKRLMVDKENPRNIIEESVSKESTKEQFKGGNVSAR